MQEKIDWKRWTVKQAFEVLCFPYTPKTEASIEKLKKAGYAEKCIVYALSNWDTQDKMLSFRGDPRFISVFENEVRKRAFKNGDPRWQSR